MMSMTADVIDLDELNTGKRREGIFGAIYWWMVKFGFAIAGGLSGVIMSLVGFDSGAETQTEGAIIGLRVCFFWTSNFRNTNRYVGDERIMMSLKKKHVNLEHIR